MGGGGDYYDRDVTDRSYRTSSGYTSVAERELSQYHIDPAFLPRNRRLICDSLSPLVSILDVTGSMGALPKILYDKAPGIIGQINARKYLPGKPRMSLCGVGDIMSDDSPLQMSNFVPLRDLDAIFKRIHYEGKGGGQDVESYEYAAYFYAYLCDIPNAVKPICVITGDERFRERLSAEDLTKRFGGNHEDADAEKVFHDLLEKFRGNVILVHRYYSRNDKRVLSQWKKVLGEERIVRLPQGSEGDLAIGDIMLGTYALVSGARTLSQYLEDMATRPLDLAKNVQYEPQSPKRIRQVEEALQPLRSFEGSDEDVVDEDETLSGEDPIWL